MQNKRYRWKGFSTRPSLRYEQICFQKLAKNPPNHISTYITNRDEPGCQSEEDQLKWGKGVLQKQVLVALCKDFVLVIIALVLPPSSSDHFHYCDQPLSRLLRGPTLKTWNIRPANCRGKVRKAARCAAKCCQDFFRNP